MFIDLLSWEFLLFSAFAIILVASSTGPVRTVGFLGANIAFIFALLGPIGLASTLFFSGLGWGLTRVHLTASRWAAILSATLLVLVFIYMLDYEFLGLFLPEAARLSFLQTVGLSFLLFRILHVMIDARSGVIDRIDPAVYPNYLLAFTTFMMGPIQRYQDFRDQWADRTQAIEMTYEAHLDAGLRILWGLVKVYVIGTFIFRFALQPNTDVLALSLGEFWLQLVAFYFFLYMNFSGYCDVVIGIGSLMGIRPPENFNNPYFAQNIADFWLRQHRTLTLWLTDYVFNPVYKKALSSSSFASLPLAAGIIAAMLTMLVSGLWHGTTIGFLIFGLVHGTWLAIYRIWDHVLVARLGKKRLRKIRASWPGRVVGMAITLHAAAFAFLFFQLDTPSVIAFLKGLL
ncbi:MBOAT family O-acyltransferase [Ruegeria atlantica]|uniref:MBOAT family O-acyltransferase n=1 Tax=Ruegeria atlantica TaxID=81569 RepID=UPI00147CC3B6|nr:MBOAT family O-acyltransferase [Ruegeria atlantica]